MSDSTKKALRAVLLLRVSTTKQVNGDDDCPLPVQQNKCTEVCKENGWTITDVVNESKSGFKNDMYDREAILKILALAEAKEFDVLVVFKLDRLGRRGNQTTEFISKLISLGIRIFSATDGEIKLASLDPRSAFVVYDDTVGQKPLFGVYYMPVSGSDGYRTGYRVYLCDRSTVREFFTTPSFTITQESAPYDHYFGDVPMIEYYNNWDLQGDFEQVTTLIDAYNTLQSDRINDKEQFVDSLLVIKGQILGDTEEEEASTFNAIKKYGVMTMDDTGDAKWLTRQFDESSVDILRRSLESDIHKFSGVPCLSDESFSGNSSGVAMKYKLLAFEQMTKIKERYFTEGLKIRLGLISNALDVLGFAKVDTSDISIIFTHDLPENEAEIAQTVNLLKDILTKDQLVKLLPYDISD